MSNNDIIQIDYKKQKLDNGLEVTVYKDDTLPLAAVNLWYKVGSANESKGKTGFAHLFEHMMFQGSENVGKEKHFQYIQEAGGTLNGSTNFDRTNYFETLPSNNLELALWLESDRMGFMLPALTREKLDNQKEVVMNERRQRYDNQPYGRAWELLFSNLFSEGHPYSWPTIGWMEDIQAFELDDIKHFFETYYSPANASLVIGGNVDYSSTFELVEKYFGEIPSIKNIPKVSFNHEALTENKFVEFEDSVQLPRIYLAWHSDTLYGKADANLDIVADLLTGSKNSRLFKTLVFEKEIAQDISAFQYSGKYDGSFIIAATARPNVTLQELKNSILEELSKLLTSGVDDKELNRSKNIIKSSFIYSLQKLDSLVDTINGYNCNLTEPNSFIFDLERYKTANKELIFKTLNKYFSKPFLELNIIPKSEK